MSTHSLIAIENPGGSVLYVYCHFDGYLEGVGRDVVGMTREQARALILKGDMSSIDDHYRDGPPHRKVTNVDAFLEEFKRSGCHYAYIINKRGTWKYCTHDGVLNSLKLALKQIDSSVTRRNPLV